MYLPEVSVSSTMVLSYICTDSAASAWFFNQYLGFLNEYLVYK